MKNENGIEKSAILKGRTLVNLCGSFYNTVGSGNSTSTTLEDTGYSYKITANSSSSRVITFNLNMALESGKKYFVYAPYKKNIADTSILLSCGFFDGTGYNIDGVRFEKSYTILVPTNAEKITRLTIGVHNTMAVGDSYEVNYPILVEYIEGMENWDISFFEGMQSVKVPVLKTVGKNLLNPNLYPEHATGTCEKHGIVATYNPDGSITFNGTNNGTTPSTFMMDDVKPYLIDGKTYIFNYSVQTTHYDGTKGWSNSITVNKSKQKFIQPYIQFGVGETVNNVIYYPMLETGTQSTPYEPYQSNTLTVNEDVTLRGIGDVQDMLDLTTGEVTERISETMINGSEHWNGYAIENDKETQSFYITLPNAVSGSFISNTLKKVTNVNDLGIDYECLSIRNGYLQLRIMKSKLETNDINSLKKYLSQNPITIQYELATPTIKTVDLTIQDQDNQPQERMKLFPKGYINTSSSTFPPILELKGITHNNKLNMTTTNGTNNTQLTTLDNLVLDGIICNNGTVVRDSYDVESGLYTKRVFRATIDEQFIEKYRDKFVTSGSDNISYEIRLSTFDYCGYPKASTRGSGNGIVNNLPCTGGGSINRFVSSNNGSIYIRLLKEEVSSYDVDGLLEWIKRNGAIEFAYELAEPQIIHMQPNMQPYVSTRPYQGEINSQGNALESSFLDYTQEESILSPKPLGEGDVLRWEQGSQCYVYENDKDYIPLTDYNQKVGTVLDLEDDEQFVENLDGGDIIVDVPFKEKAVYERELVSYEDTVIYPTNTSADPDGKVEVDYICGATWQNPDDLSDIQHLGTLREDGQYDVTIRRSGDDEIRLFDGTTNISLDGDGLNPSEFELTYFNKGGAEVGKYGDTSHTLEDCVLDSKLETGMVYGETLVNLMNCPQKTKTLKSSDRFFPVLRAGTKNLKTNGFTIVVNLKNNTVKDKVYLEYVYEDEQGNAATIDGYSTNGIVSVHVSPSRIQDKIVTRINIYLLNTETGTVDISDVILLEGDHTNESIPYFEGVGSTVVNGFTTTGKNLLDLTGKDFDNKDVAGTVCSLHNGIFTIKGLSRGSGGRTSLGNGNTFLFKKGRTYTFSLDVIENNATSVPSFHFSKYDDNSAYTSAANGKSTTITPTEDVLAYIGYNVTLDAYYDCRVRVQIEEGTQATSYEPYHSIQYALPTPITLNKVGDVADTFDVTSGVQKRNIDVHTPQITNFRHNDNYVGITLGSSTQAWFSVNDFSNGVNTLGFSYVNKDLCPGVDNSSHTGTIVEDHGEAIGQYGGAQLKIVVAKSRMNLPEYTVDSINAWLKDNLTLYLVLGESRKQTIQHTLIPSTVEMMQEPTFILPQPLRSVPNGICDRLYWDENKGHYCIEKRVERYIVDGSDDEQWKLHQNSSTGYPYYYGLYNLLRVQQINNSDSSIYFENFKSLTGIGSIDNRNSTNEGASHAWGALYLRFNSNRYPSIIDLVSFKAYFNANPMNLYYPLATPQIIDLPHLNKKLTLPTQPNTLPIGYKAVHPKMNPQIGLTIPYKQLNPPSQPQNLDFQMNKEDYVLTWNDVKEARQYNVILNDNIVATTKVPWYNTGEEIHGYILVEAQNEIADNLSKELYVKTVPKAPAQLTVAHNGLTDNYDFEISFIKSTSSLADRYTVQYRVDGGEWIIQDIPANEVDANVKVLWKFSVFEIKNQIEVWATATNNMGTNDILPLSTYYMTPTPQWTYRINSREVFLRWVDESPYDTQYKLRYQYKSDGIYRYAHFEGDKEEIGQLYEAVVALAEDDEVTLELCVISDRENLYCKPIKASKALDPNILPPKNFNYRWLSRGLIEFYWEDVYDVDLEYEAIVEHRLSGETTWIEDRRVLSATDTEGTGTVYRLQYQMEDLEEIRVKVRMKWAMNETGWSESLTTVFIPVEGNPPQWIRRTQTQEGLLVEWEAQEYIDSYHVYVKGDGVELQHLETRDNFIYVDIDYSNPIDIEIYEVSRFTGGIEAEPSDSMRFIPHQNKQQMINNIYHPDTLKYELEVNTVQKAQKVSYQINDINTTPDVRTREAMDVSISSPFIITYHPLEVDVHQKGVKSYGVAETHIKTLDVKTRETVEVLTFERITDKYGMDFTVYTPFASKYPVNLEINQVRIVCLGDSLTSGHPLYWAESGTGDVTASYPYQLAKRLKNQYEVINKGYGYFM